MITMSQREISRLRVLEQIQQGLLKRTDAAQILQISTRQLRRIERRYELDGCAGLTTLCVASDLIDE